MMRVKMTVRHGRRRGSFTINALSRFVDVALHISRNRFGVPHITCKLGLGGDYVLMSFTEIPASRALSEVKHYFKLALMVIQLRCMAEKTATSLLCLQRRWTID